MQGSTICSKIRLCPKIGHYLLKHLCEAFKRYLSGTTCYGEEFPVGYHLLKSSEFWYILHIELIDGCSVIYNKEGFFNLVYVFQCALSEKLNNPVNRDKFRKRPMLDVVILFIGAVFKELVCTLILVVINSRGNINLTILLRILADLDILNSFT